VKIQVEICCTSHGKFKLKLYYVDFHTINYHEEYRNKYLKYISSAIEGDGIQGRMMTNSTLSEIIYLKKCKDKYHKRSTLVQYRYILCCSSLKFILFYLFIYCGTEFELRVYTLSHSTSPFLWQAFQDRIWRAICPGYFKLWSSWSLPLK
jgi:hypothetical protein